VLSYGGGSGRVRRGLTRPPAHVLPADLQVDIFDGHGYTPVPSPGEPTDGVGAVAGGGGGDGAQKKVGGQGEAQDAMDNPLASTTNEHGMRAMVV
jgi:hypothetical protein